MKMQQLKMLAPSQHKCLFCGSQFVPYGKDMIRWWQVELSIDDWLFSAEWAVDRLYQDNTRYCSVECLDAARAREALAQLKTTNVYKRYGRSK